MGMFQQVAFFWKTDINTDLEMKMCYSARSSHETLIQHLTDITSNALIEVCAEFGNLETIRQVVTASGAGQKLSKGLS